MKIAQLLFEQTSGVFFVWKTGIETQVVTFLRKREGVSTQSQINEAIIDGRLRSWELAGIGHWWIQPVIAREMVWSDHSIAQQQNINIIYSITASLLSLKKLPKRERRSTERWAKEMREKHVPIICARIREIIREGSLEES